MTSAHCSLAIEIGIDDDVKWPRACDERLPQLRRAVELAANYGKCSLGQINVRICTDETIHAVNRQYLDHDYPTDVISFPYEFEPPFVEGELIVSSETAATQSHRYSAGTSGEDDVWHEMILYVVHGCLHLVGLDDQDDAGRRAMRCAEDFVMRRIGLPAPVWPSSPDVS